MMQEFSGTSILVALLFFNSWLCASTTFTGDEEIPMQQLSHAELVRLAGYGEERLSSVLVTGTVLCDACLRPGSNPVTFHVPDARIGVACIPNGKSTRKTNWTLGTTDEFGEFMVDLPSHLHATPRLEAICLAKVLRVPKQSFCRSTPGGTRFEGLKLSSVGNSIRVYSAGTLRLKYEPSHGQCSEKGEDDVEGTW